jgi:hypothetical protein
MSLLKYTLNKTNNKNYLVMLGYYIAKSSILLIVVVYNTKHETFSLSLISKYIQQKQDNLNNYKKKCKYIP